MPERPSPLPVDPGSSAADRLPPERFSGAGGVATAVRTALAVLDAVSERWPAGEAPSAIDPADLRVAAWEPVPVVRLVGGHRDEEAASSGGTPPGVRAVVALLIRWSGVDPAAALGAESAKLPLPLRPLVARALDPSSPYPLRSYEALREALVSLGRHLSGDGRPSPVGDRAFEAGLVRRVQLGLRGEAGVRDVVRCCVRLPGGEDGEVVLLIDPADPATAHHAATVRCLWPGAEIAAFGLPADPRRPEPGRWVFDLRPETILVVEPRRVFEVTAVTAAHEAGCPLHVVAGLFAAVGPLSGPLVGGRLADAALRILLDHRERPDRTVVDGAWRARRADAAWLRTEADQRQAEEALRTAVPRIRAWLTRRGAWPDALSEVTRWGPRFGLMGRSDVVFPRGGAAPVIGEMKSGRPRRPRPGTRGVETAPSDAHVAQARLYSLLWTAAYRRAVPAGGTVEAELFYAGSDDAWRYGPESRELSRLLATRNGLLDALRRAAAGERLPPATGAERCGRCWKRDDCPFRNALQPRLAEAARPFERDGGSPGSEGDGGPGSPGASPPPPAGDLLGAYERYFSGLLLRAVWHAQGELRLQLEPATLPGRIADLEAEGGLDLVRDERDPRRFDLVGPVRGAFRVEGGSVIVHRGDPGALEAFEGEIVEIHADRYRLQGPGPLPSWVRGDGGWVVEEARRYDDQREGFEGLARLRHRRDPGLVEALLGRSGEPVSMPATLPACPFPEGWHASQEEAFARGISGGTIEVVQGPPGTGKTIYVGALVAALAAAGKRVLVGALTHGAVDQAARRIVEAGGTDLIRIGARSPWPPLVEAWRSRGRDPDELFLELLAARVENPRRLRERLFGARIVAATCHRLARLPWRHEFRAGGPPPFDVAVLDEATQIPEPTALATIGLARRVVMVGDPRQLSCVVPAESDPPSPPSDERLAAAGLSGLSRSLHERLCAGGRSVMLRRQHRMHARIMAFPNRVFYEGRLEASERARDRRPDLAPGRAGSEPRWLAAAIDPGEPMVLVDVPGGSEGRRNEREARRVVRTAAALAAAGLPPADLGVVTPYRAQAALIRRLLDAEPALRGVPADTVDRFQGDEREAILVSLVGARPTGHLAHPNRINVMLTRARSKLVVFGDAEGLSRDALLAELVGQAETLRVRDEEG